jgi:hypothetical protein
MLVFKSSEVKSINVRQGVWVVRSIGKESESKTVCKRFNLAVPGGIVFRAQILQTTQGDLVPLISPLSSTVNRFDDYAIRDAMNMVVHPKLEDRTNIRTSCKVPKFVPKS